MAGGERQADRGPVRVLIVDDHPAVREALAVRIAGQPDLEVCGEAADVMEALRLAGDAAPDVAVVDIALKGGNGIDLVKRLRARGEAVRVIVWSMYGEDLYAERALRAGAMGYVNKEEGTATILDGIRRVQGGGLYLSEAMSARLLARAVGREDLGPGRSPVESLSDRELDVFRLIGLGRKTRQIADELHLSVKTVETYRDRIRHKLGVSDGAELARLALRWTVEGR
jgi:DNA-binding NarL/FixJ family response regulator